MYALLLLTHSIICLLEGKEGLFIVVCYSTEVCVESVSFILREEMD